MANDSIFSSVPLEPPDAIFGLQQEFVEDKHPQKINMGMGVYRDEEGKSYVLPVVSSVESAMAADKTLNHEYLPIDGLKDMYQAAVKLVLGKENSAIVENRVGAVQALSGTGALRLALAFLKKFHPSKCIYLSKPTWGNHKKLCLHAGYEDIREYRYFDAATNGLGIQAMLEDLKNAPNGSVFLLHACAHNPTGVDPSHEEWMKIADVMQEKGHFPLFDLAYQGFVSGDPDVDAWAVRHFVTKGLECFGASSFAKIFGLYNERAGAVFCVCATSQIAMNIHTQLKAIVRPMYSNPPNHGARIVATILNNPALTAEWRDQLRGMADRMCSTRKLLHQKLKALGTPGDWSHILNQRGMFTFTGLNPRQVDYLKQTYHVYLLQNGRINMCAITSMNIDYIAEAIDYVVRNVNDELSKI